MNALDPNLMTTKERLARVCEILAFGIVRLRARDRQDTDGTAEFALHYSPTRSGHANRNGEAA